MKKQLLVLSLLFLSINLFAQDSLFLRPNATDGKDAFIVNTYGTTNYSTYFNFAAIAWTSGGPFVTRSLIQFDFTSLPANAVITGAKLNLYCNTTSDHTQLHSSLSGSNACYLQRITSAWDESTVTWNNQPGTTDTNQVSLAQSSSQTQDYLDIDVTDLVEDMRADSNYGFMLKLQTEQEYRSLIFANSDHSDSTKWPSLVIYYEIPSDDTTITVLAPNGGEQIVKNTTYNITWESSHVDSVNLYYTTDDSTWNVIATNIADSIKSYGWTVPTLLSNKYRIKIVDAADSSFADASDSLFAIVNQPTSFCLTLKPNATDGKDAFITNNYSTTNYGAYANFAAIAWTSGGSFVTRSLIQFDYSSIPANAVITSAKLNLYCNTTSDHTQLHSSLSGSNACYLQRVTSSWDESTVTWNNQPGTTDTNEVSLAQSTSQTQDYLNIDVKALVEDMRADSNYGFLLKLQTEQIYRSLIFANSDHPDSTKWPSIVICYEIPTDTTVTVLAPNGGEQIVKNTAYNISWKSNRVDSVNLYYTTDDSTWNVIATNVSDSGKSYNWTVPNTVSNTCRIKIINAADSSVMDESDSVFAITHEQTSFCLTLKPNATDGKDAFINSHSNTTNYGTYANFAAIAWSAGSSFVSRSLIQFDYSSIPKGAVITSAKLNLYCNTTSDHPQLHSSLSGSNACYLQRITSPWDESTVTWSNQPSTTDTNEISLAQSTSQTQDYLNIDVKDLVEDMRADSNYGFLLKLQTEQQYRSLIFANSDHPDSTKWPSIVICYEIVTDTTVTVLAPNGGEQLVKNTSHNISWKSNRVDSVNLYYTTDDSTWNVIATNVSDSSKSYNWTVPNFVSNTCRIKIVDAAHSSVTDMSDSLFAIINEPTSFCLTLKPNAAQGKDAFINNSYGTVNYGSYANFAAIAWTDGGSFVTRSMIQFDYSSIPANAVITSAKLNLYCNTTSDHPQLHSSLSGSNACYLQRITSAWDESTVTWNNQPTTTATNEVSLAQSTSQTQDYLNIDVKDLVEDMRADSNYGFLLKLQTEQIYRSLIFANSDHADSTKWPSIVICYEIPTDTTVTVLAPNGGEQIVKNTAYNISWKSNRVDSVNLYYTTDDSTWNVIATNVADSSKSYNWTVPNVASNSYKIRIVNAADSSVVDESDSVFAIINEITSFCLTIKPNATDGKDAFINNTYATTNYGTYFNFAAIAWTDGGSFVSRSMIQFDYSSIPENAVITSAKLNLYCNTTSDHPQLHSSLSGSNACYLQRITSPWDESTVTWDNQPSTTDSNEVTLAQSTSQTQDYLNIDVKDLVEDMRADSNYGFLLKLQTEQIYRSLIFANSDHPDSTKWPSILICYEIPTDTTVTVLSPNGGERIEKNTAYNIRWKSNRVDSVNLYYTTDDSTWNVIATNVAASNKTYNWTVPDIISNCRIRIVNAADSSVVDESDSLFRIFATPVITLTAPNGGEQIMKNSSYTVTWSSSYVDSVSLYYSINDTSWNVIALNVADSSKSYLWTVPNLESNTCRVKIVNASDSSIADLSDSTFTIYYPVITLTAPNGGEQIVKNTIYNISWMSDYVDSVNLHYTTDDSTWNVIALNVADSSKSYLWAVPDLVSNTCKIAISNAVMLSISDESDSFFTIFAYPIITLTSPNGSELWLNNTSHDITWTAAYSEKVKIEYSDNNSAWTTIADNVDATTGTYSWNVTGITSSALKVRITDKIYPEHGGDSSDAFFTVQNAPKLKVSAPNGGEVWYNDATVNIIWEATNSNHVDIAYSVDDSNWTSIANNVISSLETYSWKLPLINSTSVKVKITDVDFTSFSDKSDNVFAIKSAVGVAELGNEALLKIYPNPATEQFYVQFDNHSTPYSLRIMNMNGQLISEKFGITENSLILNAEDLPKGVYFIEINNQGVIYRQKLSVL